MDTIEQHIRSMFDEIRKVIPKAHHFSIGITEYETGEIDTWGFIHPIPGYAVEFRTIDDIRGYLKKREILFRKFSLDNDIQDPFLEARLGGDR